MPRKRMGAKSPVPELRKRVAMLSKPGSKVSLKLRVGKALDAFKDTQFLAAGEQTILRRIQDIHAGAKPGRLTEADYINMKKIAKKYKISL